ncbi:MAG: copper ion binding protein, partial [Paracoccaceae bacterium]
MSTTKRMSIQVEGMTCASCVARVEKAVAAVPGVVDATANLTNETVMALVEKDGSRAGIVAALGRAGYPAVTETVTLAIEEMTCASCVGRVERALKSAAGVLSASVNLAAETATITFLAGATTPKELAAAATAIGYPATVKTASDGSRADRKSKELQKLTWITLAAAVLALPVFVLEMGSHVVPAIHAFIGQTIGHQTSRLIQFALTTLVLFGPGLRFFTKGIPALLKRSPDMNSLVAVGTAAAYGYSVVATFVPRVLPAGTVNVYYEAAAVIVVLVLLGRVMEARAKGRTGA